VPQRSAVNRQGDVGEFHIVWRVVSLTIVTEDKAAKAKARQDVLTLLVVSRVLCNC